MTTASARNCIWWYCMVKHLVLLLTNFSKWRRAALKATVIVTVTVLVCMLWSFWNRCTYDVLHSSIPNNTAVHWAMLCRRVIFLWEYADLSFWPYRRPSSITSPSPFFPSHLTFSYSSSLFHQSSISIIPLFYIYSALATPTILISRYMSTNQYLPRLWASCHALFVDFLHTWSP